MSVRVSLSIDAKTTRDTTKSAMTKVDRRQKLGTIGISDFSTEASPSHAHVTFPLYLQC